MVHCHNLVHEDHDMMTQYEVLDPHEVGDDPIGARAKSNSGEQRPAVARSHRRRHRRRRRLIPASRLAEIALASVAAGTHAGADRAAGVGLVGLRRVMAAIAVVFAAVAVGLLVRPTPGVVLAAIGGTVTSTVLYVVGRTSGLPFGPGPTSTASLLRSAATAPAIRSTTRSRAAEAVGPSIWVPADGNRARRDPRRPPPRAPPAAHRERPLLRRSGALGRSLWWAGVLA